MKNPNKQAKKAVGWQGLEPSTLQIMKLMVRIDIHVDQMLMIKNTIWNRLQARLKTESKRKKTVTNRHKDP